MDKSSMHSRNKARAYTIVDAAGQDPVLSRNGRGLPTQGRRRDVSRRVQRNKTVTCEKIRVASLNIGTLTGNTEELAKMLRRRQIDICTLQETRWSGAKAHDMEGERGNNGYKLLYYGSAHTRNGVGIAISERFRDAIKEVNRYDDRLMKIIIVTSEQTTHVFTAYAPQTGRRDTEKDAFWEMLDSHTRTVPAEDYLVIAGDLNGHVGETADGSRCHGGKGYGQRNEDGERIIAFCDSHDLVLINTWFIKRPTQLPTYYSGRNKSQIDFILVRRRHLSTIINVKVVPYETIATQHRPVIAVLRIKPPQQQLDKRTGPPRIKWWRFHGMETEMIPRIQLPSLTAVEETWNQAKHVICNAAHKTLGVTKPGKRFIEHDTWLWTDDVKTRVREKKRLYHVFLDDKTPVNWQNYRDAKRDAKKAVAAARAVHYAEVHKKLDTRDGERDLFRLVKRRHQQKQDIEKFYCVNDKDGKLIVSRRAASERWRGYFEEISTEEFPHPPIPQAPATPGSVPPISTEEVKEAIKRMKTGKAAGPDDIAAELWKARSWNPAPWLASLFNKIIEEQRTPTDWQTSTTVPIWKKKGSPAECSNYRPIRLLSHTMKIFERVLDKRIRDIANITINQAGFVKGCGTTDAIHAARLLLEKYREKHRPLHVAFLDLEKAFDRVPHELIWYALRQHQVPEELVRWVQLLYHDPKSRVRSAAGTSKPFQVSVGVHQGSALSPLLFVLVMDTITRDIQRPAPYTILYADDVFLASDNKTDLEQFVQVWNDRLAQHGLRLNLKKTEYLTTNPNENGTIAINATDLPRTDNFRYLGSVLSADGDLRHEVTARINTAWMKWRATTGVLCDRRMKDHLKSKVYRAVVRPAALYGAECWPITKTAERRLAVMETKMLRWISGITRFDHVRNDDIRRRYGVAPITGKMQEARLRWYGHVLRANDDSLAKTGLNIDIDGKRPKGRPKQRWLDTLHADLRAAGLHPDQAFDRDKWRTRSKRADPATKQD